MDIGFIGVGLLSSPMIKNLLADGHKLKVWNRTPAKADSLIEHGAEVVSQAAATASPGGVLISCLADDHALDEVFKAGDVAAALGGDGIHLSTSTISAECARRHTLSHQEAGCSYLAAPILGRPDAVAARLQSFLVAGDAEAKARVVPVLQALGRKVFDFGQEPATANVAKINFNFLIASAVEAMAEAFAVVEKSGIDPQLFLDMVTGSAFGCPLYQNYGQQLVDKNWDAAAFKLALGLKDVRLAQSTAHTLGARMQLGELLEQRFSNAIEHGLGDKDWTAVALDIRAEAGLD